MAQIHVLDEATIDKIAAGEVVERPSSVVKELVENAIDAGATAVTVETKEGGIEFLRVTDNGYGIEREQVRTAFLRHATSKIRSAEDLSGIHSLGFRGEALSSISAVAKVEVITKTKESLTGTRIVLEGAKEIAFEEVGAPDGTTFIMRNLFFNTPVRRKFLKQPPTEGSYIADLMEHLALSRPDISFKLVQNNQMRFHTSGNGNLQEVIYRIYGRDTAAALVPISASQNGFTVEGYLGEPIQVRSNRSAEICFLNGRFIRSQLICKAVEEGYKEYLMQHKYPFCVLHITLDPTLVDVNVHPTKMDVRFAQPRAFSDFLFDVVRDTLRRREMIPDAYLSTDKELREERKEEVKARAAEKTPEIFEINRNESARRVKVMEEIPYRTDFQKSPVWERIREAKHEDEIRTEDNSERAANIAAVKEAEDDFFVETVESAVRKEQLQTLDDEIPATAVKGDIPAGSEVAKVHPAVEASHEKDSLLPPDKPNSEGNIVQTAEEKQLELFEDKILTDVHRPKFRIVGQVFNTYWLIEYENKLLMIDQHAAHEKVNYERLMKQYREKNVASQQLLPPIVVSLSAKEEMVLRENMDVFAALGFEIEEFGGNEFTLRSVPMDLYGCDEKSMFVEVLDQLLDGSNFGSIKVIEEKIASMSCKAAIKGNQAITVSEAEVLIDELLGLENPYNCPHGRPTIVAMSKAEMDKKFKRIL